MDIVNVLTDPTNITMAFVAVMVFATAISVARPMMGQTSLEGRMKSVANRREELRRRSREALAQKGGGARPASAILTRGSTRPSSTGWTYRACWKTPRWSKFWPRRDTAARVR